MNQTSIGDICGAQLRAPRVGDVITISYGNQQCVVVTELPFGTLEVESLSTGRCYRVSGYSITR